MGQKTACPLHPYAGMGATGTQTVLLLALLLTPIVLPSASSAQCMGDCDGSNTVAVNELVLGVNIALSLADVSECDTYDGGVSVGKLGGAVNNSLNGCPQVSAPTDTPEPPPTEEVPTDTPTVPSTPDT